MPKDADRLAVEQARAEAVYRPDPAETTPGYRAAWACGLPPWPMETRMPEDPDREPALSRALREHGDALRDPAAFERAWAEVLAGETEYDVETALAVLREMEPPPRRPLGHEEDDREPLLPVTSPRVENALVEIMRDLGFSEALIATRFPDRTEDATPEPAVLAVVTLSADGRLVVSAPGAPPTRIVAVGAKRARAAAQRVAESVEEALQARERPYDDR